MQRWLAEGQRGKNLVFAAPLHKRRPPQAQFWGKRTTRHNLGNSRYPIHSGVFRRLARCPHTQLHDS